MSKKQQSKQLKTATEKQHPRKTYHFRLYPTSRQIKVLQDWLGLCCDVCNAALDERRSAYRMAGISLSYAHQCAELPACKEVRPELGAVPAQVLQDAVKRVDRAYDDFFRRVEEGQKPGFPRFKSVSAMLPSPSSNTKIVLRCSQATKSTRERWYSPN
jgi:putative transposase